MMRFGASPLPVMDWKGDMDLAGAGVGSLVFGFSVSLSILLFGAGFLLGFVDVEREYQGIGVGRPHHQVYRGVPISRAHSAG
jgi:hypothetical protein